MKTLNLTNLYDLLEQSPAISLEGRVIVPGLTGLEYDSSNEFLHLYWEEDGLEFDIFFNEGDNQEAKIEGSTITLINTDGEEESFDLLTFWNAETTLD